MKRISFRTFVICLAALYFSIMYVFHSGLDVSHRDLHESEARLRGEDHQRRPLEVRSLPDQQRPAHVNKMLEALRASDSMENKNGDHAGNVNSAVEAIEEETYFQTNLDLDNAYSNLSGSVRHRYSIESNGIPVNLNIPAGCENIRPKEDGKFISIANGMYVYSAYWDSRPNDFDNKKNGSYVRIMAVIYNKAKPTMECVFPRVPGENGLGSTSETVRTPISYYEMCENHNRAHGGFILSCPVPSFISSPLCSINVAFNNKIVSLGMRTLQPLPERRKFTICVPPLFGAIPLGKLVEFIELSQILGANHIMFYVFNIPGDVRSLLDSYAASKGNRVSIVRWDLDTTVDKTIWYHGQLISIQDCLYRNMATSQYVAFNDIDEYISPHSATHWEDLVKTLDQPKRCAFQFQSAFFDPRNNNTVVKEVGLSLQTMLAVHRTVGLNRMRAKCMVKPYEIFEKGIHHVSKPIWANLEVHQVDPQLSYLHHYRACTNNMGMNCVGHKEDNSMWRYKGELIQRLLVSRKDILKL